MVRIAAAKLHNLTNLNPRLSTGRFISQLYVSRLSFYTTDDEFRTMFSPFGKVLGARLVMDKERGRPKGFGFVTFEKEEDAQNAVKTMNGRIVQGRLIHVELAKK